jgi:hypothetical protein
MTANSARHVFVGEANALLAFQHGIVVEAE